MGAIKTAIWHNNDYDYRIRLASAASRGLVGVTRQIEQFARAVQKEFGDPADAEAAFELIAAEMRTVLVASYEERVIARKYVPSYREGDNRLSGGVLLNALRSKSQAVATADGIGYLDLPLLDGEARHWRRLNFGARGFSAGANDTENLRVPVMMDERLLFYAGSEGKPSPGFVLPAGHFTNPAGQRVPYGPSANSAYSGSSPTVDRYAPGNAARSLVFQTGGIEGRHFIDAGYAVLAEKFGPTLSALFRKWGGQAAEQFHPTRPPDVVA